MFTYSRLQFPNQKFLNEDVNKKLLKKYREKYCVTNNPRRGRIKVAEYGAENVRK